MTRLAPTFLRYGLQPNPPPTLALNTQDVANLVGTTMNVPPNAREAGLILGATLYRKLRQYPIRRGSALGLRKGHSCNNP